ncbi:hypothetical protein [Jannaschia sp. 2305UL9-9]|uniref:hypothetical protein n=1 Tax=Jannaschia sp. 2305UL9-9 TaxID=3121638 RepID=UPI003527A6E6
MHFDIYYRKNLKREPWAWIDYTRPRDFWVNIFGLVMLFDWRKRMPSEPSPFDGTVFGKNRPLGKSAK